MQVPTRRGAVLLWVVWLAGWSFVCLFVLSEASWLWSVLVAPPRGVYRLKAAMARLSSWMLVSCLDESRRLEKLGDSGVKGP